MMNERTYISSFVTSLKQVWYYFIIWKYLIEILTIVKNILKCTYKNIKMTEMFSCSGYVNINGIEDEYHPLLLKST